ncbi:hypothetical protein LXL04_034034 [Taraxacum kok-saghyz]
MEVDQEDENDSSKIVNQNQVALPRFSFDKPSKRSNLGQIQTGHSSKVSIHRRSTSYGAESTGRRYLNHKAYLYAPMGDDF